MSTESNGPPSWFQRALKAPANVAMATISDGLLPIIEIPDTYHPMMFEKPVALALSINAFVSAWRAPDQADTLRNPLKRTQHAQE